MEGEGGVSLQVRIGRVFSVKQRRSYLKIMKGDCRSGATGVQWQEQPLKRLAYWPWGWQAAGDPAGFDDWVYVRGRGRESAAIPALNLSVWEEGFQKFALIALGAWLPESLMFVNLGGAGWGWGSQSRRACWGRRDTCGPQYSESTWGDGQLGERASSEGRSPRSPEHGRNGEDRHHRIAGLICVVLFSLSQLVKQIISWCRWRERMLDLFTYTLHRYNKQDLGYGGSQGIAKVFINPSYEKKEMFSEASAP